VTGIQQLFSLQILGVCLSKLSTFSFIVFSYTDLSTHVGFTLYIQSVVLYRVKENNSFMMKHPVLCV